MLWHMTVMQDDMAAMVQKFGMDPAAAPVDVRRGAVIVIDFVFAS